MKHLSCRLLPGQMSGFKSLWEVVCLELSSPSSEVLSGGISGSLLMQQTGKEAFCFWSCTSQEVFAEGC